MKPLRTFVCGASIASVVDRLSAIKMAWGERVAFAMIYIKEAHAADVWPIGDHLTIERPNEPKNNEDRIKSKPRD